MSSCKIFSPGLEINPENLLKGSKTILMAEDDSRSFNSKSRRSSVREKVAADAVKHIKEKAASVVQALHKSMFTMSPSLQDRLLAPDAVTLPIVENLSGAMKSIADSSKKSTLRNWKSRGGQSTKSSYAMKKTVEDSQVMIKAPVVDAMADH